MHSNVQLLYLLLLFAVGVAVLLAKGLYYMCCTDSDDECI